MSEVLALRVALDLMYEENESKAEPRRVKGIIVEVCDTCGLDVTSRAHIEHCRG